MAAAPIDWMRIDTILLDMDGTLLDLRFDNWFWQELVPRRYADANGLSTHEAWQVLEPMYRAARGTIQWYCIDYWTQVLALDIAGIKRAAVARIGYLPGAEDFLVKLKASGKRCVLITNAHPLTLAIKNARVGLMAHFDACHSTHAFRTPKEHADFWPRLHAAEPFTVERTLMVDDSLPVLEAARGFGIGWLRAIRRPDSGQPAQDTGQYPAVDSVAELLDAGGR
jgi:putative hydrolase of the HAD superfamily